MKRAVDRAAAEHLGELLARALYAAWREHEEQSTAGETPRTEQAETADSTAA